MAQRKRKRNQSTGMTFGSGSVDQLPSGNWRARLPNGKSIGTFSTEPEATEALRHADGKDVSRDTLGAYVQDFLGLKIGSVEVRTMENYQRYERLHITPHIGHIPLHRLTQTDIERWWATCGRTTGVSTRAKVWRFLNMVLNRARRANLLVYDIREPVDNAGKEPVRSIPQLADADVVSLILRTPPRWRVVPLLGAGAGMRYSEIMYVQRRHIDVNRRIITIGHSRQRDKHGNTFISTGKSRSAARRISIDEHTMRLLLEYMDAFVGPKPSSFLIETKHGNPIARSNWSTVWAKSVTASGLDYIEQGVHVHDLRHWNLTALSEIASIREVMYYAGHSSVAAAVRYQHLRSTDTTKHANLIGEHLGKNLRLPALTAVSNDHHECEGSDDTGSDGRVASTA